MCVLILEDSNEKIINIFYKNTEFLHDKEITICRSVIAAEQFMHRQLTKVTIFVDNDLGPANGSGMEFLKWVLTTYTGFIELVVVTSLGLEVPKQMEALCRDASILCRRLQ